MVDDLQVQAGNISNLWFDLELEIKKQIKEGKEFTEPKITFPRGVILSCNEHRRLYGDAVDMWDMGNVSYTLQAIDVINYILKRTDLDLSAASVLIKQGIIAIYSVLESSLRRMMTNNGVRPLSKSSDNIKRLRGKIPGEILSKIEKVRDLRGNIHLHLAKTLEYNAYDRELFKECMDIMEDVRTFMVEVNKTLKQVSSTENAGN